MKVQTANGPVELTAEMVKPGMVLELADGKARTLLSRYGKGWECDPPCVLFGGGGYRLLGCDPSIATREDCATYGIAPGIDAGAHGFARLRDGGAVDLQRAGAAPVGAVITSSAGRLTVRAEMLMTECLVDERFVGLDARHASPEDVRRLCCGASSGPDGQGTNPITGEPIVTKAVCCTLAIGHDGDHEDIATGVRWKAGDGRCDSHMPGTNELARCALAKHADGKHRARDYMRGMWYLSSWRASPAGQVALRDAAVAKAIADVPAGCSASGWANVVRVIAADVQEYARKGYRWSRHQFDYDVRGIRDPLGVYARARFVDGYGVETATRSGLSEASKAAVGHEFAERLFAAYEAGR